MEESKKLFSHLLPSFMESTPAKKLPVSSQFRQPIAPKAPTQKVYNWADAVKFVGLGSAVSTAASPNNPVENRSLTEIITLNL